MITGGVGLIGSALARRLVDLGAQVLLIDSMVPEGGANPANIASIRDRVRVETADIRDAAAMRLLLDGQEFLFDLAAQTSHMDSMSAPLHDLEVNTTAQLQLLEACRAMAPEIVIVHAGTRQIYGRPRYIPVDEAHPLRATDVNAVNKTAGEAYHLLYHDVYGIKTRSLRLTNVYGPGMRIKDAKQNFLGIWLRLALEGKAFEVWGGEQRRDMVFVEDAAEAFLAAAVTPETAGKALNVGGDAAYSLAANRRHADRRQRQWALRGQGIPARAQEDRYRRFRHRRPPVSRACRLGAAHGARRRDQALARLLSPPSRGLSLRGP